MRRIAILLSLLLAFPALANDATKAVAIKSIPILRELAKTAPDADTLRRQLLSATVGDGVELYVVQLDDLLQYTGGDPHRLLRETNDTLHGVYAGNKIIAEITVSDLGTGLAATEFHLPSTLMLYEKVRGLPQGGEFLLRVPALECGFMARDRNGVLTLYPLHDFASFTAGRPYDAAGTFKLLADLAKTLDAQLPG